mmetsp:Transcript_40864/g.41738  ORF Transcript_40864/g.41738 Transcript_40864/m.41738 type:complete len:245 (-) Transcript_40864:58-792(-)
MLYPEIFHHDATTLSPSEQSPVRWLGWVDNDMWFSSEFIRGLLEIGKNRHILHWRGNGAALKRMSWGPITLFDSQTIFHTLMPLVKSNIHLLAPVLNDAQTYRCYDEWGDEKWGGFGHQYSFSYILSLAKLPHDHTYSREALRSDMICCERSAADKVCKLRKLKVCGYCRMYFENNRVMLINDFTNISYSFCHFEYTKKLQRRMFQDKNLWHEHLFWLEKDLSVYSAIKYGIGQYIPPRDDDET